MANKKTVTEQETTGDVSEIVAAIEENGSMEDAGVSATTEEKTVDSEARIYLGATFKGVATGTVYKDGRPVPALEEAIKAMPVMKELLIPVSRLVEARRQLQSKESALSKFYEMSKSYVKGE